MGTGILRNAYSIASVGSHRIKSEDTSGMLLFLADEPIAENERDGMSQRIKWVDDQFREVPRLILRISLTRNWRRQRIIRSDVLVVERLNLFLHLPRVIYLGLRSKFVYVHSCHHALPGLILYFLGLRIITDVHGVVPEEMKLRGYGARSILLSIVERVVVNRSDALIFVTDSMRSHFRRKYAMRDNLRTYVIPIITNESRPKGWKKEPGLVIYAGGLQSWQRVDRMLDAIERTGNRFRFLFLTGSPDSLRQLLKSRGMVQVEVDSVPRHTIFEYYDRASLGFVLRQDSLVNRVACPTKLVEYMCAGIIPIVEQPLIGDFYERGYEYILVDEFESAEGPNLAKLENMRNRNWQVAQDLEELSRREFLKMKMHYMEE
jgi:glycosyltransferase involved in cell wall biosynthesis